MKILMLGGTRFIGKTIVETATARGHEVTLFNRGNRPEMFPGLEQLTGDRETNLEALEGRTWDAVIDTCGYVPRIVAQSVRLLRQQTEHYTFISTLNVYDHTVPGVMDETHPTARWEDESVEEISQVYGPMKARCEETVREHYPDRGLIVRCGLVAGPGDHTDRLTYWPHRIGRGGEVLAPGDPNAPIQFIDVRDLSEWIVRMVEARQHGTYNATGPEKSITVGGFLEQCVEGIGSGARLTWVDDDFLLRHEVGSWIEMPLWIPRKEKIDALMSLNVSKAQQAGLTYRPLRQTIQDILAWDRSRPGDYVLKAGLSAGKEQELLDKWRS
ncbi:NAD-dependent epimerase/dehydratase family protein [Cohnella pontilimi]|uniref:NAD-dependent epimerase/dehydratase family protein n=1 Tax=Cohnella pontilimi TaxID=2564100 RepID=A0A4U0F9G1_9BACL|nr:NAD-dependent epimerase/dehydratase family protein [Cohnella pontilimi]TJY41271.1 NAD-dependent epimerase/dehydratase family protein [Cohnella pontilimi]